MASGKKTAGVPSAKQTMSLDVKARFIIMGMLPKHGSVVTMIIARGIKENLDITSDEASDINLRSEFDTDGKGGRTIWNEKGSEKKQYKFNQAEVHMLQGLAKELDSKGEVSDDALDAVLAIQELHGAADPDQEEDAL